jgi:SAM-dependent methyltransferase
MYCIGDGDYKAVGVEFRNLFTRYGGLKPDDRVLDVGCGIGRMAGPLTEYLSARGEYVGFDIVKQGVEWCQSHITPRYPNFHFYHSNVRNKFYNPEGVYEASSYKFPHDDGSFDFVFLTSVFTHMFPADLENYLKEISRVLKKGGKCFITMFLLNEESQQLLQQGVSDQNFVYKFEGYVTANLENPEASIAFEEAYMRQLFSRFDLSFEQPIHYGRWCGRKDSLSYQDVVITIKK